MVKSIIFNCLFSYSGLPQNVSDTSCASQYKMAVEGVPGTCGSEMTVYTNDVSSDEQTYIPYVSDFNHSKFKIDPNEIYTFHDSDVIASEITVTHTEDSSIIYNDSVESKVTFNDTTDSKKTDIENIKIKCSFMDGLSNGEIKEELKEDSIPNGHFTKSKQYLDNAKNTIMTKILKANSMEFAQTNSVNESVQHEVPTQNVKSSSNGSIKVIVPIDTKNSINNVNMNHTKTVMPAAKITPDTFLDVFKREKVGNINAVNVKTEPIQTQIPAKSPVSTPKKSNSSMYLINIFFVCKLFI